MVSSSNSELGEIDRNLFILILLEMKNFQTLGGNLLEIKNSFTILKINYICSCKNLQMFIAYCIMFILTTNFSYFCPTSFMPCLL